MDVEDGPKIEATVSETGKMKNIDSHLSSLIGIFVNQMGHCTVKDKEA